MSGAGFLRLRVVLLRVVLFRAVVVLRRLFGALPASESDSVMGVAASLSRGASAAGASTGDAASTEVCPPAAAVDVLSGGCSGEATGTSAGGACSAALAADFLLAAARLPGERRRGRAGFFSDGRRRLGGLFGRGWRPLGVVAPPQPESPLGRSGRGRGALCRLIRRRCGRGSGPAEQRGPREPG